MARLTAEERERAIGMVHLGASYAYVERILNCTKVTTTRSTRRYRVTGRTADRPWSGRSRVTAANEDHHLRILHLHSRFLTVTSSVATGLGHMSAHCTSSTMITCYQGLSTIHRDDIDQAKSTLIFMLDMSVSMLATSELATCTHF